MKDIMILSNIFLHLFKINMHVYLIDEFAPVPENTMSRSLRCRMVARIPPSP